MTTLLTRIKDGQPFWEHGEEIGEKKNFPPIPPFSEVFGHVDNYRNSSLWEKYLVFGQYNIKEVLVETKHARWQRERARMLGSSHEFKWNVLRSYLHTCRFSRHSRVVVTNYVYALKRGGFIK